MPMRTTPSSFFFALAALLSALAACGPAATPAENPPPPPPSARPTETAPAPPSALPPAVAKALSASDRSEEDRALDAGRHPGEMLAFFGIAPGMRVADLAAGFGYTTELLARVVGADSSKGKVYGQNNRFVLEKFAEKGWSERLAKPVNQNIIRVDREFDEPIPPDVRDLDAVIMVLFYHDTVWQKTDRDRMNKAIFEALKSGGVFGVVDHSGRPGTGTSETQTLHRIEEKVVREEIERAGFKLDSSADFLRNPADTRDWNASPKAAEKENRRGTSDRFVLKFMKP